MFSSTLRVQEREREIVDECRSRRDDNNRMSTPHHWLILDVEHSSIIVGIDDNVAS